MGLGGTAQHDTAYCGVVTEKGGAQQGDAYGDVAGIYGVSLGGAGIAVSGG